MSVFETVVYQTISNKENADYVELHGPFPALNISSTFLGAGYYFWDDHIELAHWWGKVHCNEQYFICEGKLKIEKDLFFDLVGSRQDQKHFQNLIDKFGVRELPIGNIIEMLKDLESKPNYKGVFPYKVVRAIDTTKNSYKQTYIKFASNNEGATTLSPRLIICMLEKNKVHLPTYKVVHPEEYTQ